MAVGLAPDAAAPLLGRTSSGGATSMAPPRSPLCRLPSKFAGNADAGGLPLVGHGSHAARLNFHRSEVLRGAGLEALAPKGALGRPQPQLFRHNTIGFSELAPTESLPSRASTAIPGTRQPLVGGVAPPVPTATPIATASSAGAAATAAAAAAAAAAAGAAPATASAASSTTATARGNATQFDDSAAASLCPAPTNNEGATSCQGQREGAAPACCGQRQDSGALRSDGGGPACASCKRLRKAAPAGNGSAAARAIAAGATTSLEAAAAVEAAAGAQPESPRTGLRSSAGSPLQQLACGPQAQLQVQVAAQIAMPRSSSLLSCTGVLAPEVVLAAPLATCGATTRPRLVLPLPMRREAVVDPWSPKADPGPFQATPLQALLPPAYAGAGATSGPQSRRGPAALRAGGRLPARLHALDDQTVLPREVYSDMLRLGDAARGRLGYGQHRLAFVGPGGTPVLRLAV